MYVYAQGAFFCIFCCAFFSFFILPVLMICCNKYSICVEMYKSGFELLYCVSCKLFEIHFIVVDLVDFKICLYLSPTFYNWIKKRIRFTCLNNKVNMI